MNKAINTTTNHYYTGFMSHPNHLSQKYGKKFYHMGGGSGYVLGWETIRALVEKCYKMYPSFMNENMRNFLIEPYNNNDDEKTIITIVVVE